MRFKNIFVLYGLRAYLARIQTNGTYVNIFRTLVFCGRVDMRFVIQEQKNGRAIAETQLMYKYRLKRLNAFLV